MCEQSPSGKNGAIWFHSSGKNEAWGRIWGKWPPAFSVSWKREDHIQQLDVGWLEKLESQAEARKLCSQTSSRQKLGYDIFAYFAYTDLSYKAGKGGVLHHFKICFVCYITVGFMNASPMDFQNLKSWNVRHVVQNLHSSQRSQKWWFPSDCMVLCQGWGFIVRVPLSLSYQFWCSYFLSHPKCKSHSFSFSFSLRGHCSTGSCIFSVFIQESWFRSLLWFHLHLQIPWVE